MSTSNLGTCEFVCYILDNTTFAEMHALGKSPMDAFIPEYCDVAATSIFDRGELTEYPDCNGPIRLCDEHLGYEQEQKKFMIAVNDGTLFEEDDDDT